MPFDPDTDADLPADLAAAHALLREQAAALRGQAAEIDLLQQETAKQKYELAWFRRKLFGRSSEQVSAHDLEQLLLGFVERDGVETEGPAKPDRGAGTEDEWTVVRKKRKKKKGHGRRKGFPEGLPRVRIPLEVPEEERRCPCCGDVMPPFGEEESQHLEFRPCSFYVVVHARAKYGCPKNSCAAQTAPVTAELPPLPVNKGLAGPGLLAQVVVSKYADHQPLSRQRKIYRRHGVDIPETTMLGWVEVVARHLDPLVVYMRRRVLTSRVIHTDDTGVKRLEPRKKGPARRGHFWVYSGDAENPYVVFDATASRSRDGPVAFLEGFKGYLQADAFGGYEVMYRLGHVIEVACWAHARRKFTDASETDPRRAGKMLVFIRRLYFIEKKAKDLDDEARKHLRQEEAAPILEEIRAWVDRELPRVLPKSPMGKAFTYLLNQWEALNRYLEDGALAIDNNVAERELRHIAVGRKNWLFTGSENGARNAATLFSVIASAKRHGIDPLAYVRDLLHALPAIPEDERDTRFAELVPDNWVIPEPQPDE